MGMAGAAAATAALPGRPRAASYGNRFGGGGQLATAYSVTDLTPAHFRTRTIDLDNSYAWEIETNTTPGGGTNFIGGDQFNFGNMGSHRITAGGAGNQAFARIAGAGLGSTTPPGKQCQFLNPQALPLFLSGRFALSSDSGSGSGVLWIVKLEAATNGPTTAKARFGMAWNLSRQKLEVRGESDLGNIQEYQVPMAFDQHEHYFEVYADGAQIAAKLDSTSTWATLTDVSTSGVTGAGATGTALPIMMEMPVVPSYVDWGVNNISDSNTNFGIIWHGPITYGVIDRPEIMGSVR